MGSEMCIRDSNLSFPSKTQLCGAIAESLQYSKDGRVHFYLLPYCKNIGLYGTPFKDGPGLSCRMICDRKPSPLFGWRKKMNDFATMVKKEDGMTNFPDSVEGVEELYKYKFVYSPKSDLDETGFMKKNAHACYMNIDNEVIQDFFLLIDNFMQWRAENDDGGEVLSIPVIIVHNYTKIDISPDKSVKFRCPFTFVSGVINEGVNITDVPPPVYPKRFVILKVASEKSTHVDMTIFGNCKPFHSKIVAQKIPVKLLKLDKNDDYFEKFYTIHDYEIGDTEKEDYICKEILQELFEESPIILQIVGGSFHGAARSFLDKVKALSNVYLSLIHI